MGYITTTTEVEVDIYYDDISDDEVIEIIEDRIDNYRKSIDRYPNVAASKKKKLNEFISNVKEAVGITTYSNEERTLQDDLYEKAFEKLKSKYTLEQIENL